MMNGPPGPPDRAADCRGQSAPIHRRQAVLYFVAALLFVVAGTINTLREGISVRTFVALIFTGLMLFWGQKAWRRRA